MSSCDVYLSVVFVCPAETSSTATGQSSVWSPTTCQPGLELPVEYYYNIIHDDELHTRTRLIKGAGQENGDAQGGAAVGPVLRCGQCSFRDSRR